MNASGKSDGREVPVTSANTDGTESSAASIEGRRPAGKNTDRSNLNARAEAGKSKGIGKGVQQLLGKQTKRVDPFNFPWG